MRVVDFAAGTPEDARRGSGHRSQAAFRRGVWTRLNIPAYPRLSPHAALLSARARTGACRESCRISFRCRAPTPSGVDRAWAGFPAAISCVRVEVVTDGEGRASAFPPQGNVAVDVGQATRTVAQCACAESRAALGIGLTGEKREQTGTVLERGASIRT